MENKGKTIALQNQSGKINAIRITICAMFMAMIVVLSSFGIPVPGGHLYFVDIVICLAAILLNPIEAFIVAGVGSFLGDFFFYPPPMFVSLVTHGLQAFVISLFSHKILKNKPVLASGIGVTIGAIIEVVGYTLGKIYVYATLEYAIMKLPYQIAQAALGAILGMLLCWKCGIYQLYDQLINKKGKLRTERH